VEFSLQELEKRLRRWSGLFAYLELTWNCRMFKW